MKKIKLFIVITPLLVISMSQSYGLGSGALGNQSGISTKSMSHGFAFAGVADDPSAIFFNPAGLTQVKGFRMMTGASVLAIESEHTNPNGSKDKMASNLPLVPYFYISSSQSDSKLAFGLGINSPFGLVTEWKGDSFSQYYATESKLLMYDVNPTIAYALTEKLSIGAGINYVNIFETELNQDVPGLTEGSGKFSGDGHAWGYNFGVHLKPGGKHTYGLSYRSQVNVPLDGETELKDISAPLSAFLGGASSFKTGASTEVKLPQSILFGYGFKFNEKTTFFADYEWVNWSSTENTDFSYRQNNALLPQSIKRDWKSTSNIGIGAETKLNPIVDLRFGALAYERVVPSSTLESSLPDSSRWILTLGSGFHFRDTTLDLGYNAIFFNDRNITNSAGNAFASMNGKYETMINIFSIGVSQKWGGQS